MGTFVLLLISPLLVAALLAALLWVFPVPLWVRARRVGLHVSPLWIVGMRLRGVPPHEVVEPMMAATEAGLRDVDKMSLECQYLAGGSPASIVQAMIEARDSGQELGFMAAAALELAGHDPVETVRRAAEPRRVKLGRQEVRVADGTTLRLEITADLRTRLEAVVGGTCEAEVLERVREAYAQALAEAGDRAEAEGRLEGLAATVVEAQAPQGAACELVRIEARLR